MPSAPNHVKLSEKAALFKRVFETEDGLQLLVELKRFCHLEEPTIYMGGHGPERSGNVDPLGTIYNEGKRVVLLHMMKLAGLTYQDIERQRSIDEREAARDIEDAVFNT